MAKNTYIKQERRLAARPRSERLRSAGVSSGYGEASGSLLSLSVSIRAHAADSRIHVTDAERTLWNLVSSLFDIDAAGNVYVTGDRGFYTNSFVSARGSDPEAGSGAGGLDVDELWSVLGASGTEKINASHIPALDISAITGLQDALDSKLEGVTKGMVEAVLTGTVTSHNHDGRYAPLSDGLIPSQYLPGFVDDVLEYPSAASFPDAGESGKIYVALDTNLAYRWGGSGYVEISPSLALGHTSSTAYPGDEGAANAAAIQALQGLFTGGAANKVAHSLTIVHDGGSTSASDKTFDGSAAVTVTIPTTLPASDVYAWAKAATKPSYTWSEIGGKPSVFTPAAHKHVKADITDFPTSWAWSAITGRPSTLAGYGITDGVNEATASGHLSASVSGHKLSIGVASGYAIPSGTQISLWNKIAALFDIDADGNVYVTGDRGFYSNSFVSARGSDPEAGSGAGGLDVDELWSVLGASGTEKIDASHIPALSSLSGQLTNAQLAYDSISVAGVTAALGGSVTTAQIAAALTAAGYKLTDTVTTLASLGITATAAELNRLDGMTASTAELNCLDGISGPVQSQLNAKQATITGAATSIVSSNLTANRALVSSSGGKVAVSAVSATELGYLDGVTSNIQTQLNSKAAVSALSAYLPLAGGTMTGAMKIDYAANRVALAIEGPASGAYIAIKGSSAGDVAVGSSGTYGAFLQGGTGNFINIKSAGGPLYNNTYPLLHSANYASILDSRYQLQAANNVELYLGGPTLRGKIVILLHPDTKSTEAGVIAGYGVQGTFYLYRPTGNVNSSILISSGAGYNYSWSTASLLGINVGFNYSDIRLVTCNYGGKLYRAIHVEARQDIYELYFRGVVSNRDENFGKAVQYYSAETGAVVNSEVNGSLANFEQIGNVCLNNSSKLLTSANYTSYAVSLTGAQTVSGAKTFSSPVTAPAITYGRNYVTRCKSVGWYRCFSFTTTNASYPTAILRISREFNTSDGESYIFAISLGYNGKVSITQLSGTAGERTITKIRVAYVNSSTAYVDFYYSWLYSSGNIVYVSSSGHGVSQAPAPVNDTTSSFHEFDTADGCKSDGGFAGTLSGNAATATRLATARTLWGKPFDGTGNVSGDMTGVDWINGALLLSHFGSSADGSDTARLVPNGHNVEFGGPGYSHIKYYLRPKYGSQGITKAALYIQNAPASDSPEFTTTHAFENNGNATHIGSLTAGSSITSGGHLFMRAATGRFIFNSTGSGFMMSMENGNFRLMSHNTGTFVARLAEVAMSGNVGIKAAPTSSYALTVAGAGYFSGVLGTNGMTLPYGRNSWNSMASTPAVLQGAMNQSADAAHPLFRVKNSAGDAIVFGGLGSNTGFYGFTAERISSGANSYDWYTTWNVGTGRLTHNGDMTVGGLLTASAGLTTPQYVQVGGGRLKWDASANALYVEKSDGTACGLYSTGFLSSHDADPGAGTAADTDTGAAVPQYDLLRPRRLASQTCYEGSVTDTTVSPNRVLTVSDQPPMLRFRGGKPGDGWSVEVYVRTSGGKNSKYKRVLTAPISECTGESGWKNTVYESVVLPWSLMRIFFEKFDPTEGRFHSTPYVGATVGAAWANLVANSRKGSGVTSFTSIEKKLWYSPGGAGGSIRSQASCLYAYAHFGVRLANDTLGVHGDMKTFTISLRKATSSNLRNNDLSFTMRTD